MREWIVALIQSSSLFYLLFLVPFCLFFIQKNHRIAIPIPGFSALRKRGIARPSVSTRATQILWWLFVGVFVLGLVTPQIPKLKTVVVQSSEDCARDIVTIVDVSGSMQGLFEGEPGGTITKFEAARDTLYSFAKGRSSDCFTTILFSGPSRYNFPEKKEGYAVMVNSSTRDPDEIVLALKEGIDIKKNPTSSLLQLSQGTHVSEGLVLASDFLSRASTAKTQALLLISDLGNEDTDNEKAISLILDLLKRDVTIYVFGVDVYEGDTLAKQIGELTSTRKVYYFEVGRANDFKDAYQLLDRIEPSRPPRTEAQIVSVRGINSYIWWAVFSLWGIIATLEIFRKRIP